MSILMSSHISLLEYLMLYCIIPASFIGVAVMFVVRHAVKTEMTQFFSPPQPPKYGTPAPCPQCGRLNYFKDAICPACGYSFEPGTKE